LTVAGGYLELSRYKTHSIFVATELMCLLFIEIHKSSMCVVLPKHGTHCQLFCIIPSGKPYRGASFVRNIWDVLGNSMS